MTDQELMDMAKKAAEYAYVPYSKFPVGAALECSDGTIFTGCNVENAAYGDTICAERTAAVKAVSSGHRDFVRIAIWGNSKEYCYPCGSCRQFLQERQGRRELREPQALGDDAVFLRLLIASKKNTAEDQI